MKEYFISEFDSIKKDAVVLEDSILIKDELATAGTKMLYNFISPINATVMEKLKESDIVIAGKCVMNEFGIGSIGKEDENSGVVRAVLDGYSAALANDYWGIVRRQAMKNDLVYLYPTYGRVSRLGLIQCMSSVDQIGILSSCADKCFDLLQKISGHDEKDGNSLDEPAYLPRMNKRMIRKVILKNGMDELSDNEKNAVADFGDTVSIEVFELLSEVFYILAGAEIANNTNRYDGVKFGYRAKTYKNVNDLYERSRTEGLGRAAKLQSILGNIVLAQKNYENYYNKSMKIRAILSKKLAEIFETADILIVPVSLNERDPMNLAKYFALASLAGCPSLTCAYKGIGVIAIAKQMNENALLSFSMEVK